MPRVYRATPLHPYLHGRIGSIPIELARPDPGAIRRALRVLEDGGMVGIFPEGPFGRDGRLVRGHPGVGLVALRAGVPVVPAAITGTFQALVARRWHIPAGCRSGCGSAVRCASAPRPSVADPARARGRDHADHGRDRRHARRAGRGADRRPVMGPGPPRPGAGGSASLPTAAPGLHRVAALRPPPLALRPRGQRGVGAGARHGRRPGRASGTRSWAGSRPCGKNSRRAPSRSGTSWKTST